MKVNIGPYKTYYSLYIGKTHDNQTIDKLIDLWNKIFCEKLPINKWFLKINDILPDRKVSIKVHDYDTWNIDHTLSLIITPLLKQLKETKHGAPLVDDEDVPDSIKSTSAKPEEKEYDTDEFWFDRWNYVIDEMIFAFESISGDWESQFHHGEFDYSFKETEKDGFKTIEFNRDNYYFDEKGHEACYERIKNGLRLFSKYYFGLWT